MGFVSSAYIQNKYGERKRMIPKNEDDEAMHYFMTILPRIKKATLQSGGTGRYEIFE
jgi:hypothetical protein